MSDQVSTLHLDKAMKEGLCEVISEHRPKSQEASHGNISGRKFQAKRKGSVKAVRKERICVCGWYGHIRKKIGYTTRIKAGARSWIL